jgi:hypothetical protein
LDLNQCNRIISTVCYLFASISSNVWIRKLVLLNVFKNKCEVKRENKLFNKLLLLLLLLVIIIIVIVIRMMIMTNNDELQLLKKNKQLIEQTKKEILKKRILNSQLTIKEVKEFMKRQYDMRGRESSNNYNDHLDSFLYLIKNKKYEEFTRWYYRYLLITSHGK